MAEALLLNLKELNVFSQFDHYAGICVLMRSDVTSVIYCGVIFRCD
jgi:hypothetical protein